VDGEVFRVEADGVEEGRVFVECPDEGCEVGDGAAVDLADDEVLEGFVADGGGGGDDAAEEDDAVDFSFEWFGVLVGGKEVEGGLGLPVLAEALKDGE